MPRTQRRQATMSLQRQPLTRLEIDILRCISHGMTNRLIGKTLGGYSENATKAYVRLLYGKLLAYDGAHAVRIGFELELLKPGEKPLSPRR